MVIEERDLIFPPKKDATRREIYECYYSLQRLRRLAEKRYLADRRKHDLWLSLLATFRLFEAGGPEHKLGIARWQGTCSAPMPSDYSAAAPSATMSFLVCTVIGPVPVPRYQPGLASTTPLSMSRSLARSMKGCWSTSHSFYPRTTRSSSPYLRRCTRRYRLSLHSRRPGPATHQAFVGLSDCGEITGARC